MKPVEDTLNILLSVFMMFCFFILLTAGFFGFKVLDFIDNCMRSEDES